MLQAGASATASCSSIAHRSSLSATRIDGLSAWFLLVLSTLAIPIAIFSIGYVAHGHFERRSAFVGVGFNVLVGAVELVFAAGDAITFLFAWELMTLANAALVATEHEERDNRRAAFLYLVMSHVATGCLIAGFLIAGIRVRLAVVLDAPRRATSRPGPLRDVLFVLFFVGFGVKAGIIPLHVWLPEAHPAAPSSISALMSGVLIKTGIYGIVRVCAFGLGAPTLSWGVLVLAVGGVSAVLGVLYALMQHDLKRLLAYHSIENIGIILLGLGAGMMALAYGRSELAGDRRRGEPVPRAEPRGVQGPAVPRRRRRRDGDRHAADRAVRRPAAADAVDRAVLPRSARWRSPACRPSTASRASG